MVLSALTTSDRRRDLFDEGVYCRGQYTPEELSSWLSKRTTADQEVEPVAEVSRFVFSGKRGSRLAVQELPYQNGAKVKEWGYFPTALRITNEVDYECP